jgi:hypothetical protein
VGMDMVTCLLKDGTGPCAIHQTRIQSNLTVLSETLQSEWPEIALASFA